MPSGGFDSSKSMVSYRIALTDVRQNQMQESLLIFEMIMSLKFFHGSRVVLLLTKFDIFREKLKVRPIRDYFPDYTGRFDDSKAGLTFFVDKFLRLKGSDERELEIFCGDVTDTKSFRPILQKIMTLAANNQGRHESLAECLADYQRRRKDRRSVPGPKAVSPAESETICDLDSNTGRQTQRLAPV